MRRFVLAEIAQRRRITAGVAFGAFTLLFAVGGSYQAFGGPDLGHQLFGGKTPAAVSAFSGSRNGDLFSPHHFLAYGFNHPLFLVLVLSLAVSVGASSVASDVETGRAELLYARPIPRTRFLRGRVIVWIGTEAVVLVAATAGARLGAQASSSMRSAGVGHLLWLPVQTLALAAFFAGVGFLASARSRTRSAAIAITVAVATMSYLANFVSLLWQPIAWLHRVTPFGYYEPLNTIDHGLSVVDAAVLVGAAAVFITAAAWMTTRRDLV